VTVTVLLCRALL